MRRIVGLVLMGLGAFLVAVGLIAQFWAPGVVLKTPLDIDQTTHLSGTANKLNVATGELELNPILTTNYTRTDSNASDSKVAVWTSVVCVVIDRDDPPPCVPESDDRLVQVETDAFATDRVTALAVPGLKYLPPGSVEHEGLINKFPFDTEKKDYPYWDSAVNAAVTAKFLGTERIFGVETYHFRTEIEKAAVDIAEGTPGTYSGTRDIFVEPRTGAIQDQREKQTRWLENGDLAADVSMAFTDAQKKTSADEADKNIGQLDLLLKTVPLVGMIVGVLLFAGGLFLVLGTRRSAGSRAAQ